MSVSLKNALVNIAGELDTMTDDDSFTIPLTKMQEFADQFAGTWLNEHDRILKEQAWEEGYLQGADDERIAQNESNGKTSPAKANPYRSTEAKRHE